MSNDRLDNIFKQQLTDAGFEPSEALWQRMDAQLEPLRNQRDRKRRVAAFWLLFLLLGGAAGTWFVLNGKQPAETGTPREIAGKQSAAPQQNTSPVTGANVSVENKTSIAAQPGTENAGAATDVVSLNPSLPAHHPDNNTFNTRPGNLTQQKTSIGKETGIAKQKRYSTKRGNNRKAIHDDVAPEEIVSIEPPIIEPEKMKEDSKATESETVLKNETPTVAAPATQPVTATAMPQTPVAGKAKAENKKKNASPLQYVLTGGTNFSSPFRKPGIVAGIMFRKTVDGKHLFAGVKIATNKLHHEFTSAAKINQFPVVTDAEIDRVTTIQMPFGYEFGLNGKGTKPAGTFLSVGFEPSYITGLRTIFYDDNGIPGGPRTTVYNSPLLSKAINKFNVSFIAGIRKQLTPKTGLSLNAGYNLIDITDKQYYNRTSNSNNMRYVQLGLQWRLNK
jgi:cytoskeletal protein RodZ